MPACTGIDKGRIRLLRMAKRGKRKRLYDQDWRESLMGATGLSAMDRRVYDLLRSGDFETVAANDAVEMEYLESLLKASILSEDYELADSIKKVFSLLMHEFDPFAEAVFADTYAEVTAARYANP